MEQSRAALRTRGVLKVVFVALAANEFLTAAFAYLAREIDPQVTLTTISLFSFATCGLIGTWLQSDARRAYFAAREQGYLDGLERAKETALVPNNCPKRWLVVLYAELNPSVIGL